MPADVTCDYCREYLRRGGIVGPTLDLMVPHCPECHAFPCEWCAWCVCYRDTEPYHHPDCDRPDRAEDEARHQRVIDAAQRAVEASRGLSQRLAEDD